MLRYPAGSSHRWVHGGHKGMDMVRNNAQFAIEQKYMKIS